MADLAFSHLEIASIGMVVWFCWAICLSLTLHVLYSRSQREEQYEFLSRTLYWARIPAFMHSLFTGYWAIALITHPKGMVIVHTPMVDYGAWLSAAVLISVYSGWRSLACLLDEPCRSRVRKALVASIAVSVVLTLYLV